MRKIPFHPVLFVVFPLLSLYVANINQLLFSDVAQTIIIAIIGGMAFWLLLNLVMRNYAKSAFLASIFLFFFFSFRSFMEGFEMAGFMTGLFSQPRFMYMSGTWLTISLVFLGLLWVLLAWRVQKWKLDTSRLTLVMNFVSLVLLMSVSLYWLNSFIKESRDSKMTFRQFEKSWDQSVAADVNLARNDFQELPTIYYIILDGYARQDVLSEIYQFDNSPFIDFLEGNGFYVAGKATSNYKNTSFSLSSSLNYMYLDEVANQYGQGSDNINILKTMISRNRVFAQLRSLGYQIVTFSTGFDFTDIPSADVVLTAGKAPNNFQNTLIANTPLSILMMDRQYHRHRQHIQYTLEHLPDPASYEQPTFVFAHVVAPHPPYVLGADGEPIFPNRIYSLNDANDFLTFASPEEYKKGYTDQLIYVTNMVEIAVQRILDESKTPPIIIIQSDHGPGLGLNQEYMELSDLHERLSILNAYYFPGRKSSQLALDISPVNTFRVVFNEYFGAELPLLETRNYYSPFFDVFDFTDVTDRIQVEDK